MRLYVWVRMDTLAGLFAWSEDTHATGVVLFPPPLSSSSHLSDHLSAWLAVCSSVICGQLFICHVCPFSSTCSYLSNCSSLSDCFQGSIYQSVNLPTCYFFCLSICLSVFLFVITPSVYSYFPSHSLLSSLSPSPSIFVSTQPPFSLFVIYIIFTSRKSSATRFQFTRQLTPTHVLIPPFPAH